MTRILADLPEADIEWLDQRASAQGKSRASVLREAVATYRERQTQMNRDDDLARRNAALDAGFGTWKHRTDMGDAVAWQRRERASWTRPWDEDYEAVKAEFPDLFDAEDDRQRQIHLDMAAGCLHAPRSSDAA